MKLNKAEEWEQNHINSLTLKLIFAATLSTAAASMLAFLLEKGGVSEIRPELLFMPWGIALVLGVSMAFRNGVRAERARAAAEADKDKSAEK